MKIFFYIFVSALLLTYVPLQLLSLLTPDNYIVLYAAIFLCLIINGLFIHLISKKQGNLLARAESPTKTESTITTGHEGLTVETNPEQTAEMQVENTQLQMTANS